VDVTPSGINPVTYSAGVDVAARLGKPLPNLNARLWLLDERSLRIVNFVGNRQYITLENLSENTKAHAAISRHRSCHLSRLTLVEDVVLPTSSNVAMALRVIFFPEAAISKLITFAIF
jgi:hypothetical protein